MEAETARSNTRSVIALSVNCSRPLSNHTATAMFDTSTAAAVTMISWAANVRGQRNRGQPVIRIAGRKHVSAAPDGLYVSGILRIRLELPAQAADMIVDAAIEQLGIATLRQIEKLVAGQRDFGPFDQRAKQAEFAARKRCCQTVVPDQLALSCIEHPIAKPDALSLWRLLARRKGVCAPQNGRDAGNQLAWAERLRQIVVGAHLESDDPVDFLAPCGQQNHRYLGCLADGAAKAEAVFPRHHDVEDDEIDACTAHDLSGRQGIGRRTGSITMFAQIAGKRLADVACVLHDQNVWFDLFANHFVLPRSNDA